MTYIIMLHLYKDKLERKFAFDSNLTSVPSLRVVNSSQNAFLCITKKHNSCKFYRKGLVRLDRS